MEIADWLSTGPDRVGEPGLSEAEMRRAEETFGLTFPSLLREALALVHPVPRRSRKRSPIGRPSRSARWRGSYG